MSRSYEKGQWGVYKDRASTVLIGLLVDGIGRSIRFGERTYEVVEGVLFCPEGKRLGHLARLDDNSWVVNYGDHDLGHVLRAMPEKV